MNGEDAKSQYKIVHDNLYLSVFEYSALTYRYMRQYVYAAAIRSVVSVGHQRLAQWSGPASNKNQLSPSRSPYRSLNLTHFHNHLHL